MTASALRSLVIARLAALTSPTLVVEQGIELDADTLADRTCVVTAGLPDRWYVTTEDRWHRIALGVDVYYTDAGTAGIDRALDDATAIQDALIDLAADTAQILSIEYDPGGGRLSPVAAVPGVLLASRRFDVVFLREDT